MKKILTIIALVFIPVTSWADLMVYPVRVIMDDKHRSAQVDIINNGQRQASIKITLVRQRMTELGEFKEVTGEPLPGELFSDEVVRFSPRQVTLLPGGSQTIRMMFKTKPELPEGEYRAHLTFEKMPAGSESIPEKPGVIVPGVVSTKLVANIGVSIPVIVRHGTNLTAKVSIDPATIKIETTKGNHQEVVYNIDRTGTRSVYGDAVIFNGDSKVAIGNGFAIYATNPTRKIRMPIKEGYEFKKGDTLRIVFTERGDSKPSTEASIAVP